MIERLPAFSCTLCTRPIRRKLSETEFARSGISRNTTECSLVTNLMRVFSLYEVPRYMKFWPLRLKIRYKEIALSNCRRLRPIALPGPGNQRRTVPSSTVLPCFAPLRKHVVSGLLAIQAQYWLAGVATGKASKSRYSLREAEA